MKIGKITFGKEKPPPLTIGTTDNLDISKLDTHSGAWLYIKKWCEDEIQRLREMNDVKRFDIEETMFIRGRIQSLKDLLDSPN